MDLAVLKKKLSTYVTDAGRLKNVNDELLCDLLSCWEDWTGSGSEFYREIGFTHKQMAKLIGKAKKLKREGHFGSQEFKEIHVEGYSEIVGIESGGSSVSPGSGLIELDQGRGSLIRFPQVGQLLEYLRSAS
jgi:hypothetical protein